MDKIEILRGVIKSLDRTIRWSGANEQLIKDLAHERKMWKNILLAIETDDDDADEVIYDARTDLEAMEIL